MLAILQAIAAIVSAVPAFIKLFEKLVELYDKNLEKKQDELLAAADADVDTAIRRMRERAANRKQTPDATLAI